MNDRYVKLYGVSHYKIKFMPNLKDSIVQFTNPKMGLYSVSVQSKL